MRQNQRDDYEQFIERTCLRAKTANAHFDKKCTVRKSQDEWKKIKGDKKAIKEFLSLRDGEKNFVRYDEQEGYELFTSNKSTDTTPSLWKNVTISQTYTPVEVLDRREDGQKQGNVQLQQKNTNLLNTLMLLLYSPKLKWTYCHQIYTTVNLKHFSKSSAQHYY